MEHFLGRDREIKLLQEENWRPHAPLIVVYGRRRVGKTALVEHAYRDRILWKFEGLEGESAKRQIQNFISGLATYTQKPPLKDGSYKDWHDVFRLFSKELEGKKLVVFLDEFQWLAEMNLGFVSLFKYFWDNHFKKNKNIRFVLCGSISSFMVKRVLRSKALYGRVDLEIHLKPLSLPETRLFFESKKFHGALARSVDEILQIHMILGGIPQYLEELNPRLSFIQNLNEYALSPQGYFFQEYRRLFISHFADSPVFEKILLHLSQKTDVAEGIAKACEISTGGSLSQKLFDLELAEFVRRETPIHKGARSKLVRYRIEDEYLHFYYRFLLPHVSEILSGKISMISLMQNRNYQQWQGYAFERLCLKHAEGIARYLQFGGVQYKYGPWFQRGAKTLKGAQIDLLFERADNVLTVCEIKYVNQLTSRVIEDFQTKLNALSLEYPSYAKQKILILGKKITLSAAIKQFFDHILLAEEVFF